MMMMDDGDDDDDDDDDDIAEYVDGDGATKVKARGHK